MFAGPPVHESGPSAEPARVCLVRSSGPHVSFPSRCLACRRRWVVAHGRLLLGWVLLAAPRLQTLQFKAQCRPPLGLGRGRAGGDLGVGRPDHHPGVCVVLFSVVPFL